MPTLRELESNGDGLKMGKSEDASPSASSRADDKTPAFGLLNVSPGGKKRKETRRVTTSPAESGALSLQERSPNANRSPPRSPKRSRSSPERPLPSSAESSTKSVGGGSGRKRKAEDSDIENEGDGGNEQNASKRRIARASSSLAAEFDRASGSSDSDSDATKSLAKVPNVAAKSKPTWYSSSGDESSDGEKDTRKRSFSTSGRSKMDLDSEDESDDEDASLESARHQSEDAAKDSVIDLEASCDEEKAVQKRPSKSRRSRMSVDSDDESDDGDAKPASARGRRSGSSQEWLTSHHAPNANRSDESSDSDSDSDDDADDDDELDKKLFRNDWLNASSKGVKLEHLEGIASDHDKALQLLLWDIGFDYNIHQHQFEAIRFVAGYVPSFPLEAGFDGDGDDDDDDDANDEDVQEMLRLDMIGSNARKNALDREELMLPGRGMILADEMGLGKTIEALAGAVLRNCQNCKGGKKTKRKPTLIITPQDGVQQQWVDSLAKAGVEPARIRVIGEKRRDEKSRGGNADTKNTVSKGVFVVCTRYKILTELRSIFQYATSSKTQQQPKKKKKSLIFSQTIPSRLVKTLKREYNIENGKERRERSDGPREAPPDRFAKLMKNNAKGLKRIFGTVIIDECHFLRNVFAYWGMGAALLGLQSERTALLSGTPYNNGPSDMSALQTFIDPSHEAATVKWWLNATKTGKGDDVIEAVSGWRKEFMLRRTKAVIKDKLPELDRRVVKVPVKPSELGIYEAYEASFLWVLEQIHEDMDDRRSQKEMTDILMACCACMRMSLIHPLLPGGREATIQFSPTRKHLLQSQECKDKCVVCGDNYPSQKAKEHAAKMAIKVKEEEDEKAYLQLLGLAGGVQTDDNILDDDPVSSKKKQLDKGKGPLIALGEDAYEGKKIACRAAGSACRHFAHERCIEVVEDCTECPRCRDLSSRLHIAGASGATGKRIYCQDTRATVSDTAGFTTSLKIEQAIEWFRGIPGDEKAIFLSFFKGSLDLLEGALDELGISCCRYDGDVAKEQRSQDLRKFKTKKKHRVLLASVQSGGTGLNIVEANNVCFLDRWFNPQIHDQAESRCHRLGQKKDVKVSYLDTIYTVDVVMRQINLFKANNAQVLLADGTSLSGTSAVDYQELSGMIGEMLKAVRDARHSGIRANIACGDADAPLLSRGSTDLDSKLCEIASSLGDKKAAKKKKKTSSDSNESSDSDDDKSRSSNASSRGGDDSDDDGLKFGDKSEINGSAADSDDDNGSVSSSLLNEPFFPGKKSRSQKAEPPSSVASSCDESDDEMFNITFPSKSMGNAGEAASAREEGKGDKKGEISASESVGAEKPTQMKVKAEPGRPLTSKASTTEKSSEVVDLLSDDEEQDFPDTAKALALSLKEGERDDDDVNLAKAVKLSLQAAQKPANSLEELEKEMDDAFAAGDFARAKSARERIKKLREQNEE